MKIIVGLGNPGREYENTRHNIGFMVLDLIAKKYGMTFNQEKFNGKYFEISINGEKYLFLKPQKYMNLSGEVVRDFIRFYKLDINDLLIISDDLDMETGKIKIKGKGSSGGHNGLKNIELHIGTNCYRRIKVGIANNKDIDTKDYVLGKFNNEEKVLIDNTFSKVISIIEDYNTLTFEQLMSKYN